MSAIEKRLARLKAIRTELQGFGADVAADAVGDEIDDLETLSSNPAATKFTEAVIEFENDTRDIERRGRRR
jgi:hypothetical protein